MIYLLRRKSGVLMFAPLPSVDLETVAELKSPEEAINYFWNLKNRYPYSKVVKSESGRTQSFYTWNQLTNFGDMKKIFKKLIP